MRRLALVLVLHAAACVGPEGPPPPPRDLAPPPPPRDMTTPPPPTPTSAEVEISGRVAVPKGAKGDPQIFVTNGRCWNPETRSFGQGIIRPDGGFFVEVFVPQKTELWLCAALIPPRGKIVWSASSTEALRGEGQGEVTLKVDNLIMKKGPAVTLPEPIAK